MVVCQIGKWWSKWWIILIAGFSNGKWWSQWQTILSGGVSKWEVVVKMAKNFEWCCVKMGSSGQKQHIILIAAVSKW